MKKAIIFVIILSLCLTGCGSEPKEEPVISTVSPADCFLCGSGAGEPFYWGQNNVGIINLNTFDVMPIEINRYDDYGTLIEENTGCISSHSLWRDENGLHAHVYEHADRSRANVTVTLKADKTLDTEKLTGFLCQNCLDGVLSKIYEEATGAGVINFATRQIRPFEPYYTAFGLGDYYIDLDWKAPAQSADIDILVF